MNDTSLKEYVITKLNEVNLSESELDDLYLELKTNMLNLSENRVVQNERMHV